VQLNNGGSSGVVSVGTVNGHIRIRDCLFSGNTYGTPLNLAATTNGTIEVKNCRFETNAAGNQSGGSINGLLSAGGLITILDSTFVGNSSRNEVVDSAEFVSKLISHVGDCFSAPALPVVMVLSQTPTRFGKSNVDCPNHDP
jgi:hypothetical protein